MQRRYEKKDIARFVDQTLRDSYCVLPEHFPRQTLEAWREAFTPLLDEHMRREGHLRNRGAARYYVTLPFRAPFADPALFEDDDVLAVVEGLVGEQPVMCQIARGTHLLPKDEAVRRLASGEAKLEPVPMKLGDVMIRDVRSLHRGTPNRTEV